MELEERLRRAGDSADELACVLHDHDEEVLLALLTNPRLNEDHAKLLLSRRDLSYGFLREFVTCERLLRSYEVKLALVRHPRAPRSTVLVCLRHLHVFDLLRVARAPGANAEVRRVAEEALITQLPGLPLGERIALARQASARLTSVLLLDSHQAVYQAALDNVHLTEDGVLRALRDARISAGAADAIARHPRWSPRREVRLAIIRSPGASLARVLATVKLVSRRELAELTEDESMPQDRRQYLRRLAARVEHRPPAAANAAAAGSAEASH